MVIPLELALLLGLLSVLMMRDALRSEMSNVDRVGSVIAALGGMMMAIAGRFPTVPGETDVLLGPMAGVWVMLGGLGLRVAGSIGSLVQKLLRFHRGPKQYK